MLGILVVTHGTMGVEIIKALEMITGPQAQLLGVAIQAGDDMPAAARNIEKAFERVDSGDGVIIFTDLLGGTPSNVALAFLNRPSLEVISGVNLPMLIKAAALRATKPLREVAEAACKSGREGITAATHILERQGG